jgi:RimJ/RimL family protein N-acetyltransferase
MSEDVTRQTGAIRLRPTTENDLPTFFEHQQDPAANQMAAFTAKNPADHDAFTAHWAKIMADPTITIKTILVDEQIAGHVSVHSWFGDPEITYWLGRAYWGKGIATQALAQFVEQVTVRPLYGRAAKDNFASIRVMEKCGFVVTGYDKGFANARGQEIEEVILELR